MSIAETPATALKGLGRWGAEGMGQAETYDGGGLDVATQLGNKGSPSPATRPKAASVFAELGHNNLTAPPTLDCEGGHAQEINTAKNPRELLGRRTTADRPPIERRSGAVQAPRRRAEAPLGRR